MNRSVSAVFRLARPRQWTKNAAVAAAFLFALGDPSQNVSLRMTGTALMAVLCFCLLASGVYALNDLRDVAADRLHPTKKNRPVAAGELSPRQAGIWGVAWIGLALTGAFFLSPSFALTAVAYVALQLVYTLILKQVALVDVIVIAIGFVLRAVAGAQAVEVAISPWLLICAFLLALFMALCKRRSELARAGDETPVAHGRRALHRYDARMLDRLIGLTAAVTLLCYAVYTQWPDTVAKFGTRRLGFTLPFVGFGVYRYLHLVYQEGHGEHPEQALLTDPPLMITLALYAVALFSIFAVT